MVAKISIKIFYVSACFNWKDGAQVLMKFGMDLLPSEDTASLTF